MVDNWSLRLDLSIKHYIMSSYNIQNGLWEGLLCCGCYNKKITFYLFSHYLVFIAKQGKLKEALAHAFPSPLSSLTVTNSKG